MIYFPMPAVLNSATINSATLRLYVHNASSTGNMTAHGVTTDWLGNSAKVSWNEADPPPPSEQPSSASQEHRHHYADMQS